MSRKKKKPPTAKKRHDRNVSAIDNHQKVGKKLIAPFMSIENVKKASWINERLPEMLWATLVVTHLEHKDALNVFRYVAKYAERFRDTNEKIGITHTELSLLPEEHLTAILDVICSDAHVRQILRPLLLLDNLPARESWKKIIGQEPENEDWQLLMAAVGKTLHHQSQEATDCRWLKVLVLITSGRLKYAPSSDEQAKMMEESFKGIIYYPDYGDMRKVRPHIRASEIGLVGPDDKPTAWPIEFWNQCMMDTPCLKVEEQTLANVPKPGTTLSQINNVVEKLIHHFHQSSSTTSVDAKYDTVFGLTFYSLFILRELLRVAMEGSILGRTGLRTLAEVLITLSYLSAKDQDTLYMVYRNYGAGQAKLAWLKLVEEEKVPEYVDLDDLEALATEDAWFEFVNIDLGQWAGTDLRKMSIEANVKDVYDSYYTWTSGFMHGQWGAVRDTAFRNCFNPLHRLHRIPRESARRLSDVVPDACFITDQILEIVNRIYPTFNHKVTIGKKI